MDLPRDPITETITWGDQNASDNGVRNRGRRVSTGPRLTHRDPTLSRSNSRGGGNRFADDDDAICTDQSRLSGNSPHSPNNERRPRKARDQPLLPKFLTRPEIHTHTHTHTPPGRCF